MTIALSQMGHLFLFGKQAHKLKMRQIVKEITCGGYTIESAMSKYQVLIRSTVTKWLERVRQQEQAPTQAMDYNLKKPPTTPIEQVVQHTDVLTGQVKRLQEQLEQAEESIEKRGTNYGGIRSA
ncbi:hypothetical protein KLP40_20585 [Hymenobacter sp. NST-14]|uniref:hypothetical protein n=1 Tax=Hymenobacter piscis TaxID=2839984 RepID=UPI001C01BFD0|nr:hypothetical protein [Hymenobacter piscis]MBT9395575.1 hypothetical protein [Hymenobacter piscis]